MQLVCYNNSMSVITTYLATIEAPQRVELEKIRTAILKTAPEAKEVISYGMPGFKYHGKYLAGFDVFRNHMSFFPTPRPIEIHKNKLSGYMLAKGTIQFSIDKPLPEKLIVELIKTRIAEIDGE
jgi:uncharacterized protein YdhG (YjbR/CyaY superfamily)